MISNSLVWLSVALSLSTCHSRPTPSVVAPAYTSQLNVKMRLDLYTTLKTALLLGEVEGKAPTVLISPMPSGIVGPIMTYSTQTKPHAVSQSPSHSLNVPIMEMMTTSSAHALAHLTRSWDAREHITQLCVYYFPRLRHLTPFAIDNISFSPNH